MKKVTITHRSYVKATKALLKPGEELPIDFNRVKSAYNIVNQVYVGSGYTLEFSSDADATLFLLRFS